MREDLMPTTLEGKLTHLIQECAEVIQAVTKQQLFGWIATDPKTDIRYDNRIKLLEELQDLHRVINLVLNEIEVGLKRVDP